MHDEKTGTFWERIRDGACSGAGIRQDDALAVLKLPQREMWRLLDVADEVRRLFKGDVVKLCTILNAKSGSCSEDCSFCAQSRRSRASIDRYPLMDEEAMVAAARDAARLKAGEFSLVTSGFATHKRSDLERLGNVIARIKRDEKMETCASLGALSQEDAAYLLSRGLRTMHHNLETSQSFFPSMCTTHAYEDDVAAIRDARKLGARVCAGGIFGIGELPEDRVELAATLRELQVDSVPVNFLNPIPGTLLEGKQELTPFECLKIIAMFRLFLPEKDVIVCGGRKENLRDLQALIFAAGANGLMIGNYLTTLGRSAESDIAMIDDLGLEVRTV
jgi:biotin synthase